MQQAIPALLGQLDSRHQPVSATLPAFGRNIPALQAPLHPPLPWYHPLSEAAWRPVDTLALKVPLFRRIEAFHLNVNISSLQTLAKANKQRWKDVAQSAPDISEQALAASPTGANLKTFHKAVWEQASMLQHRHSAVNPHMVIRVLVDL